MSRVEYRKTIYSASTSLPVPSPTSKMSQSQSSCIPSPQCVLHCATNQCRTRLLTGMQQRSSKRAEPARPCSHAGASTTEHNTLVYTSHPHRAFWHACTPSCTPRCSTQATARSTTLPPTPWPRTCASSRPCSSTKGTNSSSHHATRFQNTSHGSRWFDVAGASVHTSVATAVCTWLKDGLGTVLVAAMQHALGMVIYPATVTLVPCTHTHTHVLQHPRATTRQALHCCSRR